MNDADPCCTDPRGAFMVAINSQGTNTVIKAREIEGTSSSGLCPKNTFGILHDASVLVIQPEAAPDRN